MRSEIKGSSTQVPAHSSALSPTPSPTPSQAPDPAPGPAPNRGQNPAPSPAQHPPHRPAPRHSSGNAFSPRFLEAAQGRDRALRKAAEGAGGDEIAEADGRALCAGPFEVEEVEPVVDHLSAAPGAGRSRWSGGRGRWPRAAGRWRSAPAMRTRCTWPRSCRPSAPPITCGSPRSARAGCRSTTGGGSWATSTLRGGARVRPRCPSCPTTCNYGAARHFAANPEALALLHRSLSAEALALLGRRLMGWMA